MTALRVLYSFPDVVGKPGIGSIALHQIEGAISQGVEVSLYCSSLRRPISGLHHLAESLQVSGLRVPHRALGIERAYRLHDQRVATALRRAPSSFDVVQCWPKATIETCKVARRLGIPTLRQVLSTHTLDFYEGVARETAALGLRPVKDHVHTHNAGSARREETEFWLADFLLVPSPASRDSFIRRGFPADRLMVQTLGIEPTGMDPPPAARPAGQAGLRLVFAGSCEPVSGLHHALRAWLDSGAADEGRFVICGSYSPGYRRALGDCLAHPSVLECDPRSDLGALLRASDVFVLPSMAGCSMPTANLARGSGCVLLASDVSGAPCEHLHNGLVHSAGDAKGLARQIGILHQDKTLLPRLRANTLAGAEELTWERAGEELVAAYEASAGRRELYV